MDYSTLHIFSCPTNNLVDSPKRKNWNPSPRDAFSLGSPKELKVSDFGILR